MYQSPPGYAVVTVSLAIVHRQADLYCSLTHELCEVPLKILRKFQRDSFFIYWVIQLSPCFSQKKRWTRIENCNSEGVTIHKSNSYTECCANKVIVAFFNFNFSLSLIFCEYPPYLREKSKILSMRQPLCFILFILSKNLINKDVIA